MSSPTDTLLAPIPGADSRMIGGVAVDTVCAGAARVRRMVYQPGFRWSTNIQPLVGTAQCEHAHVGFLARGQIHVRYADGCTLEFAAPQVLAIEPGHDAWVVGTESAVLIEFDFAGETVARLGMPGKHQHQA